MAFLLNAPVPCYMCSILGINDLMYSTLLSDILADDVIIEGYVMKKSLVVNWICLNLVIFAVSLAIPAEAGSENCDCYMEGYANGAVARQSGLGRIPQRCLKPGVTQFPGQSGWSYSIGYGYGMQVEGPTNAETRGRNPKWGQDRANEHERNKRLLCY